MGMMDFFTGGGKDDAQKGYDQAQNYLNPYIGGGAQDYNNARNRNNNMAGQLDQYGNPADYAWKQANQSPTDYYNNIMKGYTESPEAKYNQEMAMRASTQGGSASGMLGSGAFQREITNNANDISQRDRQQYFNNSMTSNNAQNQAIENFQRQQEAQRQQQQWLTQMGYGAATGAAGNSMNNGQFQAGLDQQGFDNLFGLGGITGGFLPFGKQNGSKIPIEDRYAR